MAKKVKKTPVPAEQPTPAEQVANGDGGIPTFLKRQSNGGEERKDTPNPTPAPAAPAPKKKTNFNIPMGMSEDEYEVTKAKLDPPKPEKPIKETKAKKQRVKRPEAPHGTFKVADWARANGKDPRVVRRILRANEDEIRALEVNGLKYVIDSKDEPKFAKLVNDGLAAETKKTVKTAKAPAKETKAKDETPAPSLGDKGKSDAPAPALDKPSAKQSARAELEVAMKQHAKKTAAKKSPAKKKAK